MKRLVRKAEDFQQDDFLGRRIEIVYNKSKYFGFLGYVDEKLRSGDKYRVFLEPQNYEENQNYHTVYVNKTEAFKWLRVLEEEV